MTTNETPVVKLGDVRQWLRAGDKLETAGCEWRVVSLNYGGQICLEDANGDGGPVLDEHTVRLISPRWERVNRGEAALDSDVLYAATEGVFLGSCRKTVPLDTPLFRLVRTRLATRRDVRAGMRVRLKSTHGDESKGLVTAAGVSYIELDGCSFDLGHAADLPVEILAEAPEQGEQLPRDILPKELEVGDMFQRPVTDTRAEKLDRFTNAILRELLSLDEFTEWVRTTQPEAPADEFAEHWRSKRVLLDQLTRVGWLALFFDWLMRSEDEVKGGPIA